MLIKEQFEVSQPIEAVWTFFGDIPQVASCLPGADLTDVIGEDHYGGTVFIRLGPVKLEFGGEAKIAQRNEATKTITVDASGADKKGRGQAALGLNARLAPVANGTKVDISMDLQLSGAAAQFGRGLIADVTAVLLGQFADAMQVRLDAIAKGIDPSKVAGPRSAGGLAIGLKAALMAVSRVLARFFLPYRHEVRSI